MAGPARKRTVANHGTATVSFIEHAKPHELVVLLVCILSAYLYKLALFPFHLVLPDVYQGIS